MFLHKNREALQAFIKAIEIDSGNVELYYERAVAEQSLLQYGEAIADFTFFVSRIDPGIEKSPLC